MSLATRQKLKFSVTTLRYRFWNPQIQQLHVRKLEKVKFYSKTDTLENFLVRLQTKATKTYPDPDPPVVAPIYQHAADAAVEKTRFDQETARRTETKRSAQKARSVQTRRHFIKIMPIWLRANLLEQFEKTTVEKLCIFARKHLSIHNLCKTDDSVMDAFSEMGHSVTDTLVTALAELSTSQGGIDIGLNGISRKFEERNTNLTNQINDFQKKIKHNSPRGALFCKTVVKTQSLPELITVEILAAASALILQDSEDLDRIIHALNGRIRTKVHICQDNSHIKTSRSKI